MNTLAGRAEKGDTQHIVADALLCETISLLIGSLPSERHVCIQITETWEEVGKGYAALTCFSLRYTVSFEYLSRRWQ